MTFAQESPSHRSEQAIFAARLPASALQWTAGRGEKVGVICGVVITCDTTIWKNGLPGGVASGFHDVRRAAD
jgi:hypothetical protein